MVKANLIIENEPLIIQRRRTYNILPTKEKEFRPSIKMVKQVINHGKAESRIKIIAPVITMGKDRPEKVHYFQYREDMLKTQQEHDTNSTSKQILGDEFKVLNQIGFGKKTLENLPNNKLLNLNFSKGKYTI